MAVLPLGPPPSLYSIKNPHSFWTFPKRALLFFLFYYFCKQILHYLNLIIIRSLHFPFRPKYF